MKRFRLVLLGAALAVLAGSPPGAAAQTPDSVQFFGNPRSSIWAGVSIPPGSMFWTSGTVAPVANEGAARGSRERYGDTRTQAVGILTRIEQLLREAGYGLDDLVYVRAYVAPDPQKGGAFDFAGWNEAYAEFFGVPRNPGKVARSTVGVAALVSPDFLIELEAFAVKR